MSNLSIADKPDGGHKLHDISTPFVGGVGVLAAFFVAFGILTNFYTEHSQECFILGICSIIIFVTGFVDDAIKLSYKLRFMVQAMVALIMALIGGMIVSDLGNLLFGLPLQLGIFAVAFTVFATIGGINALNMIDGVDGLSGSISLATLLLIGVVAFLAEDQHNLILITALAGGVVGFLYFNLRYSTKRYARVFLGDNGSMLLGFLLAWLFVDLSQGQNPAMTPVTAIWLFSIPLMDTISVMLRRICIGQSPFMPDCLHLHHLLLKAGFFVNETTCLITFLHILLGTIGLAGLYLGISEFTMLIAFLLVFFGYFALTLRPGRFVTMVRNFRILFRTRLGFAPTANKGTLSGKYSAQETEEIAKIINEELGPDMNFSIRVFEQAPSPNKFPNNSGKCFAFILNIWLNKNICTTEEKLEPYIASLQQQLKE
ncbi:MraY family glycosyltransferase [Nitrosomonas sp. Nm166]|uniref:MraY family glycosyltransferase n=1 Tax=Nitrosomonas sp. Nm166 TaxID=1881054 RepID=UPI0015A5890F|nr:MraY family glycosyltransferase [Nitrosomonas sp. Nm166]